MVEPMLKSVTLSVSDENQATILVRISSTVLGIFDHHPQAALEAHAFKQGEESSAILDFS